MILMKKFMKSIRLFKLIGNFDKNWYNIIWFFYVYINNYRISLQLLLIIINNFFMNYK